MKKLTSLFMSGILSITLFTGCSDNENTVEYKEENKQEQQVEEPKQEQKVEDEDLNNEYEEKVTQNEELEIAKKVVEYVMGNKDTKLRWEVTTSEESNTVWLKLNLTSEEFATIITYHYEDWNKIVETYIENTKEIKRVFEENGYSVNYGVMIGDIDEDAYWLGIVNGNVIYNAVDNIR